VTLVTVIAFYFSHKKDTFDLLGEARLENGCKNCIKQHIEAVLCPAGIKSSRKYKICVKIICIKSNMPQIDACFKSLQKDLQEKGWNICQRINESRKTLYFVPFSILYSRLLFLQHLNPMKLVRSELGDDEVIYYTVLSVYFAKNQKWAIALFSRFIIHSPLNFFP
jgi:hypothetical protein